MLKEIENKVAGFRTTRIVEVLDDTFRNTKKKYLVIEWIEGEKLNYFSQKKLKKAFFSNEIDFIRMMLILLYQLQHLHSKNVVHRDIRPDNIIYSEINNQVYFVLIDFGSSFVMNCDPPCFIVQIYSKHFSPPELNNRDLLCDKCDIYSLSATLHLLLYTMEGFKFLFFIFFFKFI